MEEVIAVLLAFTLLAGGPAAFQQEDDVVIENEDPASLMEEIQSSSDKIKVSEPNVTTATQLLASLPEPDDDKKATLSVYKISDETGEYDEKGSPIVTQGATEMLVTALERSRQFKILDRLNFNDFMNEQDLVSKNRTRETQPVLGKMTGAEYVIGGAITEYQIDRESGGIGLKIAGKGGSQEYAVASCAIDLRLTDTTTGEVVWSKSLKGKIRGEKVGLQAFSFMGENIVEFETGRGKQEVINLVVRTLLEEGVYELYESDIFDE
ncbi:MAG: CsgG/HfaB family protein [Halanaerobiales bacterium]